MALRAGKGKSPLGLRAQFCPNCFLKMLLLPLQELCGSPQLTVCTVPFLCREPGARASQETHKHLQ